MMNKYEIALENIKGIVLDELAKPYYEPKFLVDFHHGDITLLQELLDKETPTKPIKDNLGYKCGNCGSYTVLDESKCCCEIPRCYTCGQKVDWSDVE